MKKILFILFIFSIISIGYSQWQEIIQSQISTWTMQVTSEAWPNAESLAIIGKAWVLFCNDWLSLKDLTKKLKLDIRPWESKELCIILYNKNWFPVKVTPSIAPWSYWKQWEFLCEWNYSGDSEESKILIAPRMNQEIEITAETWKVLLRTWTITAPRNMTGLLPLCFGMTLVEEDQFVWWGMFRLRHRKWSQLVLNPIWEVYNPSILDNIKQNQSTILKIFAWIIGIRLVISIVQQVSKKKKKPSHHKK